MARFSDDLLARLKNEVSLIRLAESYGVELKKHGKDYIGHCPFHEDKTPSFVVSPETNLWHCLGACGEGGSVIDWVIKTQGVSFRHAVELLRNDHLSLAADTPVKKTTVPKLETPIATNTDDQAALQQVIDYYHQTLKQSPEAQEYLAKRGLDDAELINHFKLGYANRTLGLRLPQKNRKAGKDMREQLQRIGLYRNTGREHFNGSLVIPVQDENQVIHEVYGRKLLDNLRKGTPKHTYLPGPHAGVFNAAGIMGVEEVILCESLIDALTFWRWGFRHVTTSYGVNGFTDELLQTLITGTIKRVLIAYDRDEAGDKAALALAEKLASHDIECFRINFPQGMDANEYACQMSPPQQSLAQLIRKAESMSADVSIPKKRECVSTGSSTPLESESVSSLVATPEPKSSVSIDSSLSDALDTQATPAPQPAPAIPVDISEHEIHITLGERVYRVKGFDAKEISDTLKINLMVKQGDTFHLDKLDLYSSKQRQVFINQASVECGVEPEVIKTDLGKVLLQLETLQNSSEEEKVDDIKTLSDQEKDAALSLLKAPDLLTRLLDDFSRCGVVGEEINKLVGYLAAVSRKSDKPLAVLIQSTSAAGKSSLMDAVLQLVPEEEKVQYSAMTGQSLFYMGQTNLKHKVLAIAEEEGASNASYALKLLQSEGEVTIASTGKDDDTGDLVTKEYKVEGPVMLFLTTTAIDIDEELLNRCLVLTVDEDRAQTEAIHQQQRFAETLEGLLASQTKTELITLHQNAQRLLRPLKVVNPYANQLTFLSDKTRTRRDHQKYLMLIRAIALLHQYQRDIKTIDHHGQPLEYIEVTLEDINIANRLAHEVLGRTLDELPPQTRKLLTRIAVMVDKHCQALAIEKKDYRFSRRDLRETTQWSETQLRVHLSRLVEMEYVLVHRGSRGQSFVYELLYDGDEQASVPHLNGLLDTQQLNSAVTTQTSRGKGVGIAGATRPQNGANVAGSPNGKKAQPPVNTGLKDDPAGMTSKTHISWENDDSHRSYPLAAAKA